MAKKSQEVKSLDAIINEINAYLSAGAPRDQKRPLVCRANESTSPFILRRPTNILGLDIALSGGFPAGGISQIAGPEGVGKNALCHQTIAQVQKLYGDDTAIAWACTEFPLDKMFAQRFGVVVPMSDAEVDLEQKARKRDNRPLLSKSEIAIMQDSLGSFVVIDRGSTAHRLEAVVQLVKSNRFQLIVLDSVGAILTEQRDEKPLGEFAQQSSEAFLVTEFQKKLWGSYGVDECGEPNWTSLLIINQARANRNVGMYGKEWAVKGAYALRHGKLADVLLSRGETLMSKDAADEDKKQKQRKIGKVIKWELAKGKAGCHDGPSGSIEYYYDTGFQTAKELVDTALQIGVIERTGTAEYSVVDESSCAVDTVRGKENLYMTAKDDNLWYTTVYDLALKKAGVSCLYKL